MEIAKDFNDLTRSGNRKDMGLEAYKIWVRSVLKKIIKPEYFIMVSANCDKLGTDSASRHIFGGLVDSILEILQENNEGISIGCRIDDLIKKVLPELLRTGLIN